MINISPWSEIVNGFWKFWGNFYKEFLYCVTVDVPHQSCPGAQLPRQATSHHWPWTLHNYRDHREGNTQDNRWPWWRRIYQQDKRRQAHMVSHPSRPTAPSRNAMGYRHRWFPRSLGLAQKTKAHTYPKSQEQDATGLIRTHLHHCCTSARQHGSTDPEKPCFNKQGNQPCKRVSAIQI